jgi:hypothetical protein
MIALTLYSRPECHLCEVMLAELEPLLGQRASVEVVDISQDPGLERKYALRIPVLAAGNQELCHYRLDARRVEAFISA